MSDDEISINWKARLFEKLDDMEKSINSQDTAIAVMKTKLSAIIWIGGSIGVAMIGFLFFIARSMFNAAFQP